MFDRNPETARIGKEILPFEMGYLPEFFQKKAEAELYETPQMKTQKMRELKQLLRDDKHAKNLIFYDDFLIQFLRVKKYNAEKAFLQVKSYIMLRKKNPNMFVDLRFDSVVRTVYEESFNVLPWRCQNGCAVLVIRLDQWDPDTFSVEEVKRAIVTYLLGALQDTMTQVNGFKVILDVKCNPVKLLRHCTPNNMYLIYHGAQNVCPGRYKEVHIINDSLVFKTAWAIIKHFLSDKIKSRVYFHDTSKTLPNYFPRAILPKYFGGDLEKHDMSDWLRTVLAPEKAPFIGGIKNWPSD